MKSLLLLLASSLLAPAMARAELSVPHFFSDHMVLQRERPAAIWGTASPGSEVTVTFKSETAKATADGKGKWEVGIPTGKADGEGADLVISSGDDKITIADVLVGEVWFASGQSNMFFTMDRVPAYEELIAQSNHPNLRMFNAPLVTAVEPQDDIEGEWTLASPETVPGYSAVAFFFARKLHLDLGIPVGVIKSAWGGKPVETFTSREALNTLPGTKALVEVAVEADSRFDQDKAMAAYETNLKNWESAMAEWRKLSAEERQQKRPPRRPAEPKRALDTEGQPGVLFNSMIHPFVGYTMRGAIWYQGEGNAKPGAVPYDQTLALMINDWRERWDDDFSFYFVQLANFREPSTEPGNQDPWPLLQDRMRLVLDSTPKTGMAIINDIGEADNIHPKNKKDVGERLALWALAKDYGKDLPVFSGPLYASHEKTGDGAIRVTFNDTGGGLKARDGKELRRFEIAGEDKTWHWADAKIDGKDSVIVRSGAVADPVAVRYAWASNPEGANLVNSEGLPASVFRTDDWDDVADSAAIEFQKNTEERRALAIEIKTLKEKRDALDRKSEEYPKVAKELQDKLKLFRELTEKFKTAR
ncbi:MAG: sialate O-acetylesterase [Verrucomicrobiae bacterium]|nr:sialate O-acetylesterase [Verrucomicrobiae bacterium]